MIARVLTLLLAATLGLVGLVSVRSPAEALPAPPDYPITGVDVSYFQGPSLDWAALARGGAKFGYLRASEQDGRPVPHNNPDPYYATNQARARANGLYTGAYHRARPGLSSGTQQADVLLGFAPYVTDGRTLPPMLDIEWPRADWGVNSCYNLAPAQLVAWIREFVTDIAVRTARQAMIYTNTTWWNTCTAGSTAFAANPLFIANYSQNPPPLPAAWPSFTFWQHAGGVPIPNSTVSTPDLDVFRGDYTALARLLGGPASALLATINTRYVSAGASPLIANRTGIGSSEQFDRIELGGGPVALRARVSGRYVTAEHGGELPLIANRIMVGAWEKFRIIANDDGTFSLLAGANNRYVSAERAGASPLIANRTAVGAWERFRLVKPPEVISLLANANLRYLRAGASPLVAGSSVISAAEQFERVNVGDGQVALRALVNGRYVTAEQGGALPLIANRSAIGAWEKFRLVANLDGALSLLANANNRYVSAVNGLLIATATSSGPAEKFYRFLN